MASEIFCPICKHKTLDTDLICSFCGASLEEFITNRVAASESADGQATLSAEDLATFIDTALIPEGGVGIHIVGAPKSYYMPVDKEFFIGRMAAGSVESVLDLFHLDAFNMGVSRRHALVRRTEFGFEIMDLASRNGTWLNSAQLIPQKHYPFASGSQIRIGRMELYILYHVPGKDM